MRTPPHPRAVPGTPPALDAPGSSDLAGRSSVEAPASVLLARLADARRAGESFESAWPSALAAALAVVPTRWERTEWRHVLSSMASTWRDAFERVPAGQHERALATVAQDPDRVPIPDHECVAA